jgi:mono/diheme cytochrome c family protein
MSTAIAPLELKESLLNRMMFAVLTVVTLLPACGTPTVMPSVEEGTRLYTTNACNGCHGENAEGRPLGPNISGSTSAGIGSWTQEQFTAALVEGRGLALADGGVNALCANMPRFTRLNPTQLADLLAFLKSKSSDIVQRGPASCN